MVNNTIVLANRGNLSSKKNHIILHKETGGIEVKEIKLPSAKFFPGISGLCYLKNKDVLLFTASEEETSNSIDDGTIGDSYLGWINGFSKKMGESAFRPDNFLKLSDFDPLFRLQKIESVCGGNSPGKLVTLYLVADNDSEHSRIFKIELSL